MHHGCILFDVDLTILSKALETSKEVVEAKGVKSVRSRVDNILPNLPKKITVTEFANKILEQMKKKYSEMKEYQFSEEELNIIENIRKEKFCNWSWNYGLNPVAEIVRERRYPAGKIQVFINTKKGVIEDITFFGTFFGVNSNLTELQNQLKGVKYEQAEVSKTLSTIDITPYFAGFSVKELTEAIVS